MHFSLIQPRPNETRAAAFERSRGAYEEHQWLWERFFLAPRGTPRDFLFRRIDSGVAARFYAVSERPPRTDVPGWEVKPIHYAPKVSIGERLRFDLRANPVITRSGEVRPNADDSVKQRDKGTEGRAARHKIVRHDVVMDAKKRLLAERGIARWSDWNDPDKPALYALVHEACGRWLVAAGGNRGFSVDEATLSVDAYTQHRGKDQTLRFSSVDFSGELTVLDPTRFVTALTQGIGHAKAFGCGLLLVRRMS